MFTTLSSMGPIGFEFAPAIGSMYTGHTKTQVRGVDRGGRKGRGMGVKGRM